MIHLKDLIQVEAHGCFSSWHPRQALYKNGVGFMRETVHARSRSSHKARLRTHREKVRDVPFQPRPVVPQARHLQMDLRRAGRRSRLPHLQEEELPERRMCCERGNVERLGGAISRHLHRLVRDSLSSNPVARPSVQVHCCLNNDLIWFNPIQESIREPVNKPSPDA